MGIKATLRVVASAALTGALVFASAPNAAADQVRDDQWALKSLEAESIWKLTKGRGQTVAVIDTGVNAEHPDLKGNVLKGKDFVDGGSTAPDAGEDHGTAMAGAISARGHGQGNGDGVIGLAPEAKILPIRDEGTREDGFAASIRYAVDRGASVINISLSGDPAEEREAEEAAVAYALKRDVVIVAGTGNDGGPVGYPAAYPGVVAVSGVNQDGSFWDKSNRGKETLISAPAEKIVSTGGRGDASRYRLGTGTSDSTAYVSATVALLQSKFPDLTAGQVVNRLTKTAETPAGESSSKLPDERFGYGAIRPLAALQKDIPKGPKYGPLTLPLDIKNEIEAAKQAKEDKALEEKQDREFVILWTITGILAFLFVGAIVLTIVLIRRSRRNRNNGPGGPGAPGGYPYPPHQAPGYGMPQQQQPYVQQQMPAPPQQPPNN
jgi:type VII secretion-associated serine protease mycosin